jgi:hypothetical protein
VHCTIEELRGKRRVVYVGAGNYPREPEARYERSNPCRQYTADTTRAQTREDDLILWFERNPDSTYMRRGLNNARNQDGSLRGSGVQDDVGWVYVLVMPDEHGNHDDNDSQPERPRDGGGDSDLQRALQQSEANAEAEDAAALDAGMQASLAFAHGSMAAGTSRAGTGPSSDGAGPSTAGSEPEDMGTCTICLDPMTSHADTTQLSCAGRCRFHTGCSNEWLQNHTTCPNCRGAVSAVGGAPSVAGGPIRRQRRLNPPSRCAWNNNRANRRGTTCDRPPMEGNYLFCCIHRKPCPRRDCNERHVVGHDHLRP